MFAYDTERNQQAQDDAALDIHLDGIEDGYNGTSTKSSDWEYLKGFAEGLQRRNTEQLEQTQMLMELAKKEDLINRGECGWIDELMEHNDEPTLGYEEMEEPDLVIGSEEMTLVLPDGTAYTNYYTKCAEF